jgi:hypothetical protein
VILVVALAFTIACALGSARRLQYVLELTAVDAGALAASLRKRRAELPREPLIALEKALAEVRGADWEREIVAALREPVVMRPSLLGEAMTELDFRARRWNKVPRVSASLASSFGFLLATMALRVGLSGLAGPLDDETVLSVNGAVLDALDVAAVGLMGAALCVAIHYGARAALGARVAGAEQLIEVLEQLVEATPLVDEEGRANVATPHSKETMTSPHA